MIAQGTAVVKFDDQELPELSFKYSFFFFFILLDIFLFP